MVKMTHYLYILSTWSYVAEKAVSEARQRFGDDLQYDWSIAVTDYHGAGRFSKQQLQFYYDRLEAATGERMTTDWWREGYNWMVPDKVAAAARLLGATGLPITELETAVGVAGAASGLEPSSLREMYDAPETALYLQRCSRAFEGSGVDLRPALVVENGLSDRVILSGVWNAAPIISAIIELDTDESSYIGFLRERKARGLYCP